MPHLCCENLLRLFMQSTCFVLFCKGFEWVKRNSKRDHTLLGMRVRLLALN